MKVPLEVTSVIWTFFFAQLGIKVPSLTTETQSYLSFWKKKLWQEITTLTLEKVENMMCR